MIGVRGDQEVELHIVALVGQNAVLKLRACTGAWVRKVLQKLPQDVTMSFMSG